jgi:hypothetical protein
MKYHAFFPAICAVLLLAACATPSFSTNEARRIPEDFFGIIPDDGRDAGSKEYEFMDELGVVWMRNTFYWSGIEPQPGAWEFTGYDRYVEEAKKAGKKILVILAYDTSWSHGGQKNRNITPERLPHYLRYVEEVVRRYRGRIDAYEIWNEPNWVFWKGTNQNFYELSKAAQQKIRELDPQAKIVAGSFAWVPKNFIRGMFKAGALEGVDAISFHPYGVNPEGALKMYDRFAGVLSEFGYAGEVWVTEVGYPTQGIYPARVREEDSPEYIVKTLAGLAVRGARLACWYELADSHLAGEEPNRVNSEMFFGLGYPDYSPKKGAAAYALCGRYLAGAEYRPEFPVREALPRAVETLYFRGEDNRNTLILWNRGQSPRSVRVLLPGSGQTLHDISSGEGRAASGETDLILDKNPQFFTWISTPGETPSVAAQR